VEEGAAMAKTDEPVGPQRLVLRLRVDQIVERRSRIDSEEHPFRFFSVSSPERTFLNVESFLAFWQTQRAAVKRVRVAVEAEIARTGSLACLLDGSFVEQLYDRFEVDFRARHEIFDVAFQQRFRDEARAFKEKASSNPSEQYFLQVMFMHASKPQDDDLKDTFTTRRAILRAAALGDANLRSILINASPSSMQHDFGISSELHNLEDNNSLLLMASRALLEEIAPSLPSNLMLRCLVTETLANTAPLVRENLFKIAKTCGDTHGVLLVDYHLFYHVFLGETDFFEYACRSFLPRDEDKELLRLVVREERESYERLMSQSYHCELEREEEEEAETTRCEKGDASKCITDEIVKGSCHSDGV